MSSLTASCYPIAAQNVLEAIEKDGNGQLKEAYVDYLSCMLSMLQALRDEAGQCKEINDLPYKETLKLFKLSGQCMERARDILKSHREVRTSSPDDGLQHLPARLPFQTPLTPQSSPHTPIHKKHLPVSPVLRTVSEPPNIYSTGPSYESQGLISRLPSPPGARKVASPDQRKMSPEHPEMYKAVQRRKTISGKNITQKYANTNYNLQLFRKAAEKQALNLAKERILHQRWLERQQEIKHEAEKRWNLKKNRSQRDKEYRQNLLAEILEFEDAVKWPKIYRESLKTNQDDPTVVVNVVHAVLRCREHPLCKVCKGLQYLIYQKVSAALRESQNMGVNYLKPIDTFVRPKQYESTDLSETSSIDSKTTDQNYENINRVTPDLGTDSIETATETSGNIDDSNLDEAHKKLSLSTENINGNVKKDSGYYPVAAPRKSLPSSISHYEVNDITRPDIDDDSGDIRLPDVPMDNDRAKDTKDSLLPSSPVLRKVDSFEKVYDELGDVMFSSDSDDADDEAENDGDVFSPLDQANINVNQPGVEDDGDKISPLDQVTKDDNKLDDSGLYEELWKNANSKSISSATDTGNPVYFSLNKIKTSQDDIIPLMGHSEESDEITTVKSPVPKERTHAKISISVDPPTSPGNSPMAADGGLPLPSKRNVDDDGEYYSDLSDEFQTDPYESLIPRNRDTVDTTKPSHGDNKQSKQDSLNSNGPEYFMIEYQDETKHDNSTAIEEEFYEPLDTVEENIYEELNVFAKKAGDETKGEPKVIDACRFEHEVKDNLEFVIDTFYLKKLDSIVQEMRFGIDRLHTVLLLAYEDLDTPNARDDSYIASENILFQPLWPWLFQMFKQMNAHKEDFMKKVMKHYFYSSPQHLKVREKFALQRDGGECRAYQEAIDEMQQIRKFTSPIDKIDCAVRMSKAIHTCVERYWCHEKGEAKAPTLGCDDLLPIVAFVILKTNYAEIVSECHAMEEFIREDYLMGEEGYCLTTLHAAISYLLSLSKDLPNVE